LDAHGAAIELDHSHSREYWVLLSVRARTDVTAATTSHLTKPRSTHPDLDVEIAATKLDLILT
jgi:hypothetical protein